MKPELMTREPITITISYAGGEVFNVLREGADFNPDFDASPMARVDFEATMAMNLGQVLRRAREQSHHLPVTLVGGSIPAHEPGAYPTLACCGGDRVIVEAK